MSRAVATPRVKITPKSGFVTFTVEVDGREREITSPVDLALFGAMMKVLEAALNEGLRKGTIEVAGIDRAVEGMLKH